MLKTYIKTVNLCKYYGSIKAVDDFNFSAQKGQIIALLGPNGAGKSTLMNMISGFLSPTGGDIFVEDLNIADNPTLIKQKIGFSTAVGLFNSVVSLILVLGVNKLSKMYTETSMF